MNHDCGGHRKTEEQSVEDVTERTSVPQTVCQNSFSYQDETGPVECPADRSVKWSESATGHAEEETIMQISGVGHWYLEVWIGDHGFGVHSDSSVELFLWAPQRQRGPGGRNSTHKQKTAWCQWITDCHCFGVFILCGSVLGSPDEVPHSGM